MIIEASIQIISLDLWKRGKERFIIMDGGERGIELNRNGPNQGNAI